MGPGVRHPPPPEALVGWIQRYGGTGIRHAPEDLRAGAMRALHKATLRSGRDRGAAFALLAADALLTYALEDGAAAPDPEREFLSLLEVACGLEGVDRG